MLFSGVQLLSIGFLGEYLGRVFEGVKRGPLYLLREQAGRSLSESEPCKAARRGLTSWAEAD
jgi:polyisoprenyl-phosphate glycosyltransferase